MLSVWFKNRDTMRYPHHMALEKSINIGLEDHPTNPPWGMGSPILHHKLGVAVSQNGATPSYHICYHPFIDWIFPWNIMKSKTIAWASLGSDPGYELFQPPLSKTHHFPPGGPAPAPECQKLRYDHRQMHWTTPPATSLERAKRSGKPLG